MMRLNLSSDLYEKLLARAHEEGMSAEAFIERLLQQSLSEPTESEFTASAMRMLNRYADLHKRLA